jgi:hypothetical protein
MPIIPVQIDEAEGLDTRLIEMCNERSAILIMDGGVFSNIFPVATDRSRVFRKKYAVALKPGPLLFAKMAEVSLFFNYRDNCAEIQANNNAIYNLGEILPEVKEYLIRMLSSLACEARNAPCAGKR